MLIKKKKKMKSYTILLFCESFSKFFCTKLDLLQNIWKFYGGLFGQHVRRF